MFYVTGLDELCEPRRCQVSWFTTQSVCDRRGLRAALACGERWYTLPGFQSSTKFWNLTRLLPEKYFPRIFGAPDAIAVSYAYAL